LSQFRIKNIDTGVVDSWTFRINDAGAIIGDDVVAEDPNELAQAITDTQELLVKTGIYSPSSLINTTEGALSRIKTLEDSVGTTTLQDAYDAGRFIAVAAGRPLSLGAVGEIELDSSGNLKVNANTFRITDGTDDMYITEDGITSSNNNLSLSTTLTNNLTLSSGQQLYLKDSFLSANVPLSESGQTSLSTTSQSIIGAINEISGGFSGTDFQQIYDQSSPPEVTTTFGGGPIKFINGSGNPSTPALQIEGGIECIDFLDVDSLTVGPGVTVNLTINTDGSIDTNNDITTTTKVETPRVENAIGELLLLDSRGSANLTEIGEAALTTTNQSLFGAINEVDALSSANATSLAALDNEHNLTTGYHEIINTQSPNAGANSTSRFNLKNDIGTDVIQMDATGHVIAATMDLGIYDVISELAANVVHRGDDGTSHSAVSSHIAASNPHNVVKSVAKSGDAALAGAVTFSEGAGISIAQVGQDIEISTSSGNTLQSVYDAQGDGDLQLNTGSSKNLLIKDSVDALIAEFTATGLEMSRDIDFVGGSAEITATSGLDIDIVGAITLDSATGGIDLTTPTVGQTVSIEGVDVTDGTASPTIDASLTQDMVSATNDLASNHVFTATNGTGVSVAEGTPVCLRDDGTFWIPYADAPEAAAILEAPSGSDLYWHALGVADETIGIGAAGRIRVSGLMSVDIDDNPTDADAAIADDGGVFTNETTAANNATTNDMTLLPATPAVNDAYYFGYLKKFQQVDLNISTAGAGTWTIVWEYYDGSTWQSLPDITDPSSGFTASGLQNISWTMPNDWEMTTINSQGPFYFARARVSAYTSITTQPLGQEVDIRAIPQWRPGDALYVSRVGYSEIDIIDVAGLVDDTSYIDIDTAGANKRYIPRAVPTQTLGEWEIDGDADANIASDNTRNNLIGALNNETFMDSGNDLFMRAFAAGETASGIIDVTGAGTLNDTLTLTPDAGIPGAAVTLTAKTAPSGHLEFLIGQSAEETAYNLADAINRTSSFGATPPSETDGHNCIAICYGNSIEVRWIGPGKMGNGVNITDSSTSWAAPGYLTGGTAKIRVYLSDRSANGKLCSSNDASDISITNFTSDEGTSPFINQSAWFNADRVRYEDDRRIKVGRVIQWADPVLTFMVEPEAPRRNGRSIKGIPYDTEY
jgi:hypothetical protein